MLLRENQQEDYPPPPTQIRVKRWTTLNDQQRASNDLKRPTTSKKWLETTYNEHETT